MSLPNSGRNHNHKPVLGNDNEDFLAAGLEQAAEYEKNNGVKPTVYVPEKNVDFASPVNRDSVVNPETGTNSQASAYDDLDDYVYRQNKKRHRSHRHSSSVPSLFRKKKSKHKHRHHHHKHHRKKKRLRKWQKVTISVICVLLALIIVGVGTVVYLNMKGSKDLLKGNDSVNLDLPKYADSISNGQYITYKGVQYKLNENITSILCMGVDKESLKDDNGNIVQIGDNIGAGGHADALFLLTLDMKSGRTTLINISRETMTDIYIYSTTGNFVETQKAQICLAYAYGDGRESSCNNVLLSVQQLFYNIPINSYLALDLQGIGGINDTMDGITVVSPETIGPFTAGETYTLRGSLAQSFVRDRSHEVINGNALRMERQKIYLQSFANKLIDKTKADITFPMTLFNSATPYMCTNLDAAKTTNLALSAMNGTYNGEPEIKTIPGKVKQGEQYAEFYVNEKKFFELFLDVYYTPVNMLEQ